MKFLLNKLCLTKTLFLVVFLFTSLLPFSAMAQLVVKENTVFLVKSEISTKEKTNQFKSDIEGEKGTLCLAGKSQTLETAIDVSLPNVVLNNASELAVLSKLNIKGDLTIKKGILKLNHELTIKGKIIKYNGAIIQNEFMIIFVNDNQQFHELEGAITSNQKTNEVVGSENKIINDFFKQNKQFQFTYAVTNLYKSYSPIPLSPPPV